MLAGRESEDIIELLDMSATITCNSEIAAYHARIVSQLTFCAPERVAKRALQYSSHHKCCLLEMDRHYLSFYAAVLGDVLVTDLSSSDSDVLVPLLHDMRLARTNGLVCGETVPDVKTSFIQGSSEISPPQMLNGAQMRITDDDISGVTVPVGALDDIPGDCIVGDFFVYERSPYFAPAL